MVSESSCVLKHSKFEVNKRKFDILFSTTMGKSGADEQKNVYGPHTVWYEKVKQLFQLFRSCYFDVEDETCSGRQIVVNVDKTMEIVLSDRHGSSYSRT